MSPTLNRIQAIDAIRGFALLGILIANMQLFAAPFGEFMRPTPGPEMPPADAAAFYFVKIFVDGKFYPLFSLLFGIGLALQWERARAMGRRLLGTGLRRLAILAIIGLLHIVLLWYGDILLLYSTTGLVLLLLIKARPRTLARIGAVLLSISILLSGSFSLLAPPPDPDLGAEITVPAEMAAKPPFERLVRMGNEHPVIWKNMAHPVWLEAESQAMREGPFVEALKFRLMSYGLFLIFGMIGFWWHVAAMFLFGAALLKVGLFTPERRHWFTRFIAIGLFVGIPVNVFAATAPYLVSERAAVSLSIPLFFLGGPLLSLGYLGLIGKFAFAAEHGGAGAKVIGLLAAAGRMALTNYLMQSLICIFIFQHWGLGYYGQVGRFGRIVLAAGIYAGQLIFSALWMQRFAFGPMEWVWRSLTYLRPQPLLRPRP